MNSDGFANNGGDTKENQIRHSNQIKTGRKRKKIKNNIKLVGKNKKLIIENQKIMQKSKRTTHKGPNDNESIESEQQRQLNNKR